MQIQSRHSQTIPFGAMWQCSWHTKLMTAITMILQNAIQSRHSQTIPFLSHLSTLTANRTSAISKSLKDASILSHLSMLAAYRTNDCNNHTTKCEFKVVTHKRFHLEPSVNASDYRMVISRWTMLLNQ